MGQPRVSNALEYDEEALGAELSELKPWQRSAYTLACAQRLLPLYQRYHTITGLGDASFAEQTLGALWRSLQGESISNGQFTRMISRAEELVPKGDEVDVSVWHWFAMNSMAALIYAIQIQQVDDVEKGVWAARHSSDAIMFYLRRRDHLKIRTSEDQKALETDPAVQAELARQQQDLTTLSGGERARAVEAVRTRALQAQLFDLESVM